MCVGCGWMDGEFILPGGSVRIDDTNFFNINEMNVCGLNNI